MSGRLNLPPYDIEYASTSVYSPDHTSYAEDTEAVGVEDPDGRWFVGIGIDYPDLVIAGSRDELIRVFRDALTKLGS